MAHARKQERDARTEEMRQAHRDAEQADQGVEQHRHSERVREAGLSGREVPGGGPSADFEAPDTVIDDNSMGGRRREPSPAADRDGITGPEEDLSVVSGEDIGGGNGPDEAELARIDPLDGKAWDGDESEPLQAAEATDENYPAEKGGAARAEDEDED